MKNNKVARLSAAARREQNWGWFMVVPTIIGLLILNVWPFTMPPPWPPSGVPWPAPTSAS